MDPDRKVGVERRRVGRRGQLLGGDPLGVQVVAQRGLLARRTIGRAHRLPRSASEPIADRPELGVGRELRAFVEEGGEGSPAHRIPGKQRVRHGCEHQASQAGDLLIVHQSRLVDRGEPMPELVRRQQPTRLGRRR